MFGRRAHTDGMGVNPSVGTSDPRAPRPPEPVTWGGMSWECPPVSPLELVAARLSVPIRVYRDAADDRAGYLRFALALARQDARMLAALGRVASEVAADLDDRAARG